MNKAIIGKKLGMSQIFAEDGSVIPVTVIEAGPCVVVQKKTKECDGYSAVKVGYSDVKESSLNKPILGQFKKAGVTPKRFLKELKLENAETLEVGSEIKCDIFSLGDKVDVTGLTRGRGFTGNIQRWNASRGPMAHGSGFHRGVGSMGANSSPARVFPGKLLPGHYGHEQVTIQNLEVVKIDAARNILMVKGSIPGPKKGLVTVKETVK